MDKNILFEDRTLKSKINDEKILTDTNYPVLLHKLQRTESGMFGGSFYHLLEKIPLTEEETIYRNKNCYRG